MSKQFNFKPIVAALGTFFILSMAVNPIVSAGEIPSSFERGRSSHNVLGLKIENHKFSVSYADLNLENKEDVQVLYRRLQRASKKVCRYTPEVRIACYRETLAEAVEKFDNVDLIRIHAG